MWCRTDQREAVLDPHFLVFQELDLFCSVNYGVPLRVAVYMYVRCSLFEQFTDLQAEHVAHCHINKFNARNIFWKTVSSCYYRQLSEGFHAVLH